MPFGPEDIRKLRGGRTRAVFARDLGVTPLTVYRWELPDSAAEARRPRGQKLARLQKMVETAPAQHDVRVLEHEQVDAEVLAMAARAFGLEWRKAEAELIDVLSARPNRDTRAVASACTALIQLLHRSDARAASSSLGASLADAEEGALSSLAAAYVYAAAALARSSLDARLLDVGRVHAYAARADALAPEVGATEIRFVAWSATMVCGWVVGEQELLTRAFARLASLPVSELPPLLAAHDVEARGARAVLEGQPEAAMVSLQEAASVAERSGFAVVHARALANIAMRRLDDLQPPVIALELARASRAVARAARLGPGIHSLLALRAECEALLRMARFEEARAVCEDGRALELETGLPALVLAPSAGRLAFISGDYAALEALADRLDASPPQTSSGARASSALIRVYLANARGKGPDDTLRAVEVARQDTAGWPFLQRDVLTLSVPALLYAERFDDAQHAARRAQAYLDRHPSPWVGALLWRFEGLLAAATGRWDEARQKLEASAATFERAEDLPDALMSRSALARIAVVFGDADARELLASVDAEAKRVGIVAPRIVDFAFEQVRHSAIAHATSEADGVIERLVVPVQRLAVRGAGPSLVLRELDAVLADVFGPRAARVREVRPDEPLREAEGESRVEIGDGAGRRLVISVGGALGNEQRAALSVIATAASLALEVATLRGLGAAASSPEEAETSPEIPELVAVSPAMRRLRGEILRLASSRATVIVTGESGVGKDVVARAIHDTSLRKGRAYVAFNCAAVPRDLFEGQLFGYRRGAFTGATSDQLGVLRSADGGTVFLDEVGELPLDVQPKLLRVLDNQEVFALGDKRPAKVDVRIVAATNRDLAELVRRGSFREDLYYRLQVVPIPVPPLRERREDVLPLARHFLRALSPSETTPAIGPDAAALLVGHGWPGNVRELRNVIERTLAFAPRPTVLGAQHLRI